MEVNDEAVTMRSPSPGQNSYYAEIVKMISFEKILNTLFFYKWCKKLKK
jgi:hypothetical protein